EGRALRIYEDPTRTARELASLSAHDAKSYPEFHESFARIGRVLAPLLTRTPPSIEKPTAGDIWHFGKLGKDFRGLGKKDAYRLLRWGPMAVADLAAEWFETELLRAVVEARGSFGMFAGPWSAGTSAGLLMQAALGIRRVVRGGSGARRRAVARRESAWVLWIG